MDSRPCCGNDLSHPRITPVSEDPEYRARLSRDPCKRTENLNPQGLCTWHCPKCREQDFDLLRTVDRPALFYKQNALIDKHRVECHGYINHKTHTGNGTHLGAWAFTMTYSPVQDALKEEDLLKAVNKVMNQKSIPVKSFCWYLEYGDPETKGHPHIHGMYETANGGRIEAKHFKRAWPIWNEKQRQGFGFRGGYHRPVRDSENYSVYIAKCDGVHEKYNLPS